MGHYTAFIGRIKLSRDTPGSVLGTLEDIAELGHLPSPTPDAVYEIPNRNHAFFSHDRYDDVFSHYRYVAGLLQGGLDIDNQGDHYDLRFCGNSKANVDVYLLLLDWLKPYIVNDKGDLVLVWIEEDHYDDVEHDKVLVTHFLWHVLQWGFEPQFRSTPDDPWDVEPAFFEPFTTKD